MLKGLGVIASGAVLAACAPQATPAPTQAPGEEEAPAAEPSGGEEVVNLRFMSWAGIFDDLVAAFNESHPNIQVEMAISPWSGYAEKQLTQLAAGTNPEINWVQASFWPMLVRRNVWAVIDDYLVNEDVEGLDIDPVLWAGYEGKAYGVPAHNPAPRGLNYNIALFNEAGVELPDFADWTMDDMDAAAKAIASPPDIWGCQANFSAWFLDFVLSNGGSLYNEDETECTLNSPEAREAFKYSVDWLCESKIAPTPADQELLGENVFASEKIGMTITVVMDWDTFGASTQDYAMDAWVCLLPKMPGGERLSTAQAHPFSIPADSEYIDEAWEFIRWYIWDETAIDIMLKLIPITYKMEEHVAQTLDDERAIQFYSEALAMMDTFIPEYWGVKTTEVQSAYFEELELMMLCEKSIEDATDGMVEKINAILAEG
jgi:multiple sugar transport system substrate-binding protein